MNFELTEEQQLIVKTAREFAMSTLAPRAGRVIVSTSFPSPS